MWTNIVCSWRLFHWTNSDRLLPKSCTRTPAKQWILLKHIMNEVRFSLNYKCTMYWVSAKYLKEWLKLYMLRNRSTDKRILKNILKSKTRSVDCFRSILTFRIKAFKSIKMYRQFSATLTNFPQRWPFLRLELKTKSLKIVLLDKR